MKRLILAGAVRADGQPAFQPGQEFPAKVVLAVAARERFVGRGGEKLEAALVDMAVFDGRFERFSVELLETSPALNPYPTCLPAST